MIRNPASVGALFAEVLVACGFEALHKDVIDAAVEWGVEVESAEGTHRALEFKLIERINHSLLHTHYGELLGLGVEISGDHYGRLGFGEALYFINDQRGRFGPGLLAHVIEVGVEVPKLALAGALFQLSVGADTGGGRRPIRSRSAGAYLTAKRCRFAALRTALSGRRWHCIRLG